MRDIMVLGKLKFIEEENRYLVIEYISETEYYNFNYNNRKKTS